MNQAAEPELQRAVEALGDELAAELRICVDVLKLEHDLDLRRVAENRFTELMNRRAA